MVFRPKTNSHPNFQDREGIQNTEVKPMNMKKLIKSRRGVAIELAIGVMFLLMAFTIMLLSTAGLQNGHRVDDYEDFKEKIEINNIGEYVVANYNTEYKDKTGKEITINGENTGYLVTDNPAVSSTNINLIIYENDMTDPVLTIWLDATGKIISWK